MNKREIANVIYKDKKGWPIISSFAGGWIFANPHKIHDKNELKEIKEAIDDILKNK